jgi:hypothetical protein
MVRGSCSPGAAIRGIIRKGKIERDVELKRTQVLNTHNSAQESGFAVVQGYFQIDVEDSFTANAGDQPLSRVVRACGGVQRCPKIITLLGPKDCQTTDDQSYQLSPH